MFSYSCVKDATLIASANENSVLFGTFITYKYISTQILSLFILSLSTIIFLIVLIILLA